MGRRNVIGVLPDHLAYCDLDRLFNWSSNCFVRRKLQERTTSSCRADSRVRVIYEVPRTIDCHQLANWYCRFTRQRADFFKLERDSGKCDTSQRLC